MCQSTQRRGSTSDHCVFHTSLQSLQSLLGERAKVEQLRASGALREFVTASCFSPAETLPRDNAFPLTDTGACARRAELLPRKGCFFLVLDIVLCARITFRAWFLCVQVLRLITSCHRSCQTKLITGGCDLRTGLTLWSH